MNKLSLVSLAAVAACSGAPVIPTMVEPDPKTEAEVVTALETAKLIRDKCIGLLQDGEISFSVQEFAEKAETTLGVAKRTRDGGTNMKETCSCNYRTNLSTFVREKTSCEYSISSKEIKDGKLERAQGVTNRVSHTEKPDGRSFTRLNTGTFQMDREPYSEESTFVTGISADGSGCRTFSGDSERIYTIGYPDIWEKIPYDPAKLDSCEYFAGVSSILMSAVKDAICKQLEQGGGDMPVLCVEGQVYAPTSNR